MAGVKWSYCQKCFKSPHFYFRMSPSHPKLSIPHPHHFWGKCATHFFYKKHLIRGLCKHVKIQGLVKKLRSQVLFDDLMRHHAITPKPQTPNTLREIHQGDNIPRIYFYKKHRIRLRQSSRVGKNAKVQSYILKCNQSSSP